MRATVNKARVARLLSSSAPKAATSPVLPLCGQAACLAIVSCLLYLARPFWANFRPFARLYAGPVFSQKIHAPSRTFGCARSFFTYTEIISAPS